MTDSWRRPATTSEIAFAVDANAAHPPFEQLKSQILQRIDAGELIVGMRLPAVRQLATDLGIAPNTVARAYRELEAQGVLETRGRNGTVIKARAGAAADLLQVAATAYAARAAELGVGTEDALAFVRAALGTPSHD